MKTSVTAFGTWPKLQRHWDIRAACNFIGGGTGSGLVIGAAVAAATGRDFAAALLTGLACIAFGLTMVLLEIGRPWRALNVFFHPRTSWMTREGVVALPLFAGGGALFALHLAGAPSGWTTGMAVLTGLTAGAFVYCQARILRAARGIPAWREAALTPFILATGLAEGSGVLAAMAAVHLAPDWTVAAALALTALRAVAWRHYRDRLGVNGVPTASLAVLKRIEPAFLLAGHGLVALLLTGALFLPSTPGLGLAGGVLLAVTGWQAKLTIITRAAATRGIAIERTPVRGRGNSRLVVRPGWQQGAA